MENDNAGLETRLRMKVIGITGGIGSGKSSAVQIVKELGAKVIDADLLSKELFLKESSGLQEIVNNFGQEVINDAFELDREKLGDIVFNNTVKLKQLEQITHKYIISAIVQEVDRERQKGCCEMIALEASLPVEHGFKDVVDEIWVISSNSEERIKRVMHRNSYSREDVLKRMNSQPEEKAYLKIADRVIENNGTFQELKEKIIKLVNGL